MVRYGWIVGAVFTAFACAATSDREKSETLGATGEAIVTATLWGDPTRLRPSTEPQLAHDFGASVAVDGSWLLVGDPENERASDGLASGAAFFFTLSEGAWVDTKVLPDDASADMRFGESVAIEAELAIIGAPGDGDGAAYTFARSGMAWAQQQKLTLGGSALLGRAVALDGNTALVGADAAVHVFVRSGTTWALQQTLLAGENLERFGESVAISGDLAAVGAPANGLGADPFAGPGSVLVFQRTGSAWIKDAKLTPAQALNDGFGRAVAIAGETVVGGSWGDDSGEYRVGQALVYTRQSGTWSQQATLKGSDGRSGLQVGYSLALSGDLMLLGAPAFQRNFPGRAYLVQRVGSTWTEVQRFFGSAPEANGNHFARSLAFDEDILAAGVEGGVDVLRPVRPQGAACSAPAQCSSGQCVEGVCCNEACSDACSSCLAVRRPPGSSDGQCGPVLVGTDPRDSCPNDDPCYTGSCALGGQCALTPPPQQCQAGVCLTPTRERRGAFCSLGSCPVNDDFDTREWDCMSGYGCFNGECRTSCTIDNHCDIARGFACFEGECKTPTGSSCSEGEECQAGFCVDGVCCDSDCSGACVACTSGYTGLTDGTCGPIPADEDPDDECERDEGYPESCGGDGYCSGNGSCRRYAFEGTACGDAACEDGVATELLCNGAGQCLLDTTRCGNYACSGAVCAESCRAHRDCDAALAYCSSEGICAPLKKRGASCQSDAECDSHRCHGNQCRRPTDADEGDGGGSAQGGGCSTNPGKPAPHAAWLLLSVAALVLARRQNAVMQG